jgi:hypothetical protein
MGARDEYSSAAIDDFVNQAVGKATATQAPARQAPVRPDMVVSPSLQKDRDRVRLRILQDEQKLNPDDATLRTQIQGLRAKLGDTGGEVPSDYSSDSIDKFVAESTGESPKTVRSLSSRLQQIRQTTAEGYSAQNLRRVGREAIEGITGAGEVARTMVQNPVATVASGLAGLAGTILPGPAGQGANWVERVSKALSYEPQTKTGRQVTEVLAVPGQLAEEYITEPAGSAVAQISPVAGAITKGALTAAPIALGLRGRQPAVEVSPARIVPPGEGVINLNVPTQLRQQLEARQAAQVQAAQAQTQSTAAPVAGVAAPVAGTPSASAAPVGVQSVGAAAVSPEKLRIENARSLPVPIELSKDQATRNPADVRFARETAKDPVLGQSLQEKYARDNDLIQQNMQALVERTGAEMTGVAPAQLGEALVNTVEPYRQARKGEVKTAYKAADDAGEMSQPVSYAPLVNYLNKVTKDRPTLKSNNPILGIIEDEIKANDPNKTGQISLRQLEDIRQVIVNEIDPTQRGSMYHGNKLKKAIDVATEKAGGDLYKKARQLNARYMSEFEDTPVIKNLTAIKKGTTDRAVAIENLVDKSILRGPASDVQKLFATLDKSGPDGVRMANELRGYVAEHIKNEATKSVDKDINGKPYVSTAKLDNIIRQLDKSGKLELLFGKEGAAHYRTLNDVTKDLQTVPKGTTNPSGTAAQIGAMLAETGAQFALSGVPAPIATLGKMAYDKRQTTKKINKINEFIEYGKNK